MAITQRRNMEVQFASVIGTGRIRTIRREVPGPATTLLREVYLEGGAEFVLIPSITTDTPDHFGNGNAISFGAATAIMFGTDGSLLDGAGNPINGTVFVSVHGLPQTQRAITVLGTLGRVRGYRWVQPNQGTSAWSRV
jgi:hypothetical protein